MEVRWEEQALVRDAPLELVPHGWGDGGRPPCIGLYKAAELPAEHDGFCANVAWEGDGMSSRRVMAGGIRGYASG